MTIGTLCTLPLSHSCSRALTIYGRYIYVGGLPFELTEGDVVCIFSQYGEVLDVQLARDRQTGKSRGFAWLRYEDQRSTILAVDNFSGAEVLGRKLKVDHVASYRLPKLREEARRDAGAREGGDGGEEDPLAEMNVARVGLLSQAQIEARRQRGDAVDAEIEQARQQQDFSQGLDPEDPMYEYLINERRQAAEAQASASNSRTKKRTEREDDDDRQRRRHRDERDRKSRHDKQDRRDRRRERAEGEGDRDRRGERRRHRSRDRRRSRSP